MNAHPGPRAGMVIEAGSAYELAAFMGFGALAAGFVLKTPGLLDKFAEWNATGGDAPFTYSRPQLEHLAKHLNDIAEAAVLNAEHQL